MGGSTLTNEQKNWWDKLKPVEICRIDPPTKEFNAIMEQTQRQKGEPYAQQVAQGLHPDHEQEFRERVERGMAARTPKQPGVRARTPNRPGDTKAQIKPRGLFKKREKDVKG